MYSRVAGVLARLALVPIRQKVFSGIDKPGLVKKNSTSFGTQPPIAGMLKWSYAFRPTSAKDTV